MKRRLQHTFFAVEAVLYIAFLTLDLLGFAAVWSTALKFVSILLVGLTALYANERFLTPALVLTVCADVFLLVLDRYYLVGIGLFLIVQMLYTLYMAPSKPWSALAARIIPAAVMALLFPERDVTEAAAAAYITWFAVNLIHALATRANTSVRFSAGMALFFLCDLCVGLHNLPPNPLSGFASIAMWAFYLPGQVLILSSANTFGGNKE